MFESGQRPGGPAGGAQALGLLGSLAAAEPGRQVLATLLEVEPSALSPEAALLFVQVLERQLGWLHAVQARALVATAGAQRVTMEVIGGHTVNGDPDPGIDDVLREEIASATRWGSGQAQHRVDVARLLLAHFPQVLSALELGEITYGHASAIASAAQQLPGFGEPDQVEMFNQACAHLQDRVLRTALRANVTRTRRAASLAAAAIADTDRQHRRRYQRLAQSVTLIDDPDGLSTLTARMPAHHAHACMAAIRNLANDPMLDLPCDASIGQRRALAMATLIIGPHPSAQPAQAQSGAGQSGAGQFPSRVTMSTQLDAGASPAALGLSAIAPRPLVHLDVVISLDALLGMTNEPGSIPGAGHVPADVVRELLEDATMRRMVTDPLSGHLLDVGRQTYRVPAALRRFIQARDQNCRFPGCGRRAAHCEIDHAIPWSQGGTTGPANLGALCTRHHRMKTHAGWSIVDADVGGSCTWQSPFGHEYRHESPPPIPPSLSPSTPTLATPDRRHDLDGSSLGGVDPDGPYPF